MTSELKPCPFCWPEPHMTECHQDDYGYWKVSCGRCGCHSGIRPNSDPDAQSKVIDHWNTRAVPDVPELVRYGVKLVPFETDLALQERAWSIVQTKDGAYVRYDQAAPMLAAKYEEFNKLEADLVKTKALLENERDQQVHDENKKLKAKLAQIKAQEPAAWMHPEAGWVDVSRSKIAQHCKVGVEPLPLYAALSGKEPS